jgi:phosphoglycerol transferase MdoB-like AlkP superfamily enzyme
MPEGKESKGERLDRELGELLQELRVALPGVQVLFAFLLTVPFSQGFARMTGFQRGLYFTILLSTAVTSVMFIAPTAYHRLRWRDYDKEQMLMTANRLTITGTVFLALSIGGAVYLIGDFMFGAGVASITAGAVAALLAWFWFGLPLFRKLRDESDLG